MVALCTQIDEVARFPIHVLRGDLPTSRKVWGSIYTHTRGVASCQFRVSVSLLLSVMSLAAPSHQADGNGNCVVSHWNGQALADAAAKGHDRVW